MDTAGAKKLLAGSPVEVLIAFLKLGVTSFGGPIAHIGYFREEFVVRRRWLDEETYAELVGLCQFLPGPASSQVGFTRCVPVTAVLSPRGLPLQYLRPSPSCCLRMARMQSGA
jgi:hypothetical protein